MLAKKHVDEGRRLILAVCDDGLLGKRYEEAGKRLDVSQSFYGGEKISEAELMSLLGKAYIINAVGKDSVAACAKVGLCELESAPAIKGIPYFQAVLF